MAQQDIAKVGIDLHPFPPLESPGVVASTWRNKTGIGAILALVTAVGAMITAIWPAAAPVVQKIEKAVEIRERQQLVPSPIPEPRILPPIPDPGKQVLPAPQVSNYASAVRVAWMLEIDPQSKLQRVKLIYLYRRTILDTMIALNSADASELYTSFRLREKSLGLDVSLLQVRAVIRTEWARQIPEVAPFPLDEPMRARIADFLNQTIAALEGLP